MFNIYFKEMKKLFSLIALVGVIAACTPEQIKTAFKLAGGKVTVNVEVNDCINGGAYAGDYTVSSNFGTVSGNTITMEAGESQAIPAGDFKITVSGPKLAKDYEATFAVPLVLAGGEATIKAIVVVGEPVNGYTIDSVKGDKTEGESVYFLANSHYPTMKYSHAGIENWYYNNSEYLLEGVAKYETPLTTEATDIVDKDLLGFEGIVSGYTAAATTGEVVSKDYEFFVSAWAMWNVVQTNKWAKSPVTVIAFKDANNDGKKNDGEEGYELGSFNLTEKAVVSVQAHEIAYPGAPGHAHYEHGHGVNAHGAMDNAGGGIAYNE